MPNILDALGLQVATRAELLADLTAQMQAIYGNDINLEPDTPDGQFLNILVQAQVDLLDLIVSVYNSFSPDAAIGNTLDQRVAINGIVRQAGTYTVTPITVVVSQSVNLYGLDQEIQDVYTVSDNDGNLWQLEETQLGLAAGTHVLNFRAAEPGENLTIPNTITTPVTIVLGVVSVNNPTTYTVLGVNEESDIQLRVRRQKSVSLGSQGYLAGLLAALENIDGVSSAFVYENNTSITDGDGVPGHSIWVIVAGTALDSDIAQAIYTKRNAGCGMFGSEAYTITQVDGSPFIVNWDEVITRNMFITFDTTSIDGITPPDIEAIRTGLATGFVPGVYQELNINGLATLVQEIDPNTLVTDPGFSLGTDQTLTLSGVAASGVFKVSYNGNDSANINWNDAIGVVQTKVQAVTGLSNTTVTGSIASQSLIFDLSGESDVLGLITVVDNTLATSAPAPIIFAYDEDYSFTLLPPSKQNQLIVSYENIIILPMQLKPLTSQVTTGNTRQFSAYGGYGDLVFSISVNNSGGSINASTGLYTAGVTPSVVDTVLVTDSFGNTGTATVTIP